MVAMVRRRNVALLSGFITIGVGQMAVADVTFYDSRAALQTASGQSGGVDFFFPSTPYEASGTGHVELTDPFSVPGTDVDIRGLSDSLFLLGADFSDSATIGLSIDGPYNTADGTTYLSSGLEAEFSFGGDGITVFGIDVFSLQDVLDTVVIEVNVESVSGDTLFEDELDFGFVGFLSTNDMAIRTITFGLVGPITEGDTRLGFDNMLATTAAPIPAPSAAILGLLGLASVRGFRRLRSC